MLTHRLRITLLGRVMVLVLCPHGLWLAQMLILFLWSICRLSTYRDSKLISITYRQCRSHLAASSSQVLLSIIVSKCGAYKEKTSGYSVGKQYQTQILGGQSAGSIKTTVYHLIKDRQKNNLIKNWVKLLKRNKKHRQHKKKSKIY